MNDEEWGHRFGKEALRRRRFIENHPCGATVAGHLAVENMKRQAQAPHHPLRMAIALQFWRGDMGQALRLARLLADIEPRRREDVTLIFASRFDVERTKELRQTERYCHEKFPVIFMRSKRMATGHPDGCFGLWAGTLENCYEGLIGGAPFDNVAIVEADGAPARFDWIDTWKKRHQRTLDLGKFVTGARMEGNEMYESHINGSCAIHVPWWKATTSLHSCPSGIAWDCFMGPTMLAASSASRAVCNLYGAENLSLSVFKTLGRDYAWIASVKDDSAYRCARSLIPENFKKLYESAWGKPKKEKHATWKKRRMMSRGTVGNSGKKSTKRVAPSRM